MQLTSIPTSRSSAPSSSAFLDEPTCPSRPRPLERPRSVSHMPQWARDWQRLLFDNGWLLPGQPPEFGGRNATVLQQFVHLEELCRRRIYHSFNPQGVNIVAASLISFGTDGAEAPVGGAGAAGRDDRVAGHERAQRRLRPGVAAHPRRARRRPLRGQRPEGVDLRRARRRLPADVRAHRPGRAQAQGHQRADHPDRHRPAWCAGRSPTSAATTNLDFNEVFFTDVRVPAENLVGPLNGGWGVANGSLGHERTMMWLGFADRIDNMIARLPPAHRAASATSTPRRSWTTRRCG